MLRWAQKRHPKKSQTWIRRKYFAQAAIKDVFAAKVMTEKGTIKVVALFKATLVPILRHIKVRQNANPFDPAYKTYFKQRSRWKSVTALDRQEVYRLRAA